MGFPNRDRPNGREKRDGPRSGSARRSRDREESPSSRRSRSRHRISPSKDEHESLDSNSSHLRNSSSREMQLDYKNRPRRDRDGRGCYNGSGSRSDGGDDLRREGRQDEDFGDDRDPRGSGSFDRERYRDLDQDRDRDRHRDGGPERDRYRDRWLEDKAYRGGSSHRDRERWERGRPRDWDREAPRGSRRPRSIDRDWEDPERWRGNDGYRYEGHLDGGDRYEQQHHHHRQSDERYHRRNTPSTTVILQGLAPDITMEDIRPVVLQCGLTPKGVRVIKRRDTDLIMVDKAKRHGLIVDIAVPLDSNIARSEAEKKRKYQQLAVELRDTWNLKTIEVPHEDLLSSSFTHLKMPSVGWRSHRYLYLGMLDS